MMKHKCILSSLFLNNLSRAADLLVFVQEKNKQGALTLTLPPDCSTFHEYYDKRQDQIRKISILDELLAGNADTFQRCVLEVKYLIH